MTNPISRRLFPLIAAAVLLVQSARPGLAETFVGSNNDSRVVVALQVYDDAAQSLLPEGWTLVPFPGGALEGANTLLVLVDRFLARDAEGNPASPSAYRGVALASLAKQDGSDEVRTFVTRIYATPAGYDPYGNTVPARISRSATIESAGNDAPTLGESWTVHPEGGGEMAFSLRYQSGTPSWSASEAMPYSNVNPEFHRIYRYDQLVDLAMSEPLGKPLAGEIALESSIAELAGMFDGNERIVAVIVIPMYVREVFLP